MHVIGTQAQHTNTAHMHSHTNTERTTAHPLSLYAAPVDNYMGNWSCCDVLHGANSATIGRSVAVGAPLSLQQPPAPAQHQEMDTSQRTSNAEK